MIYTQAWRFVIVGVISTVVNYLIFFLLFRVGLDYIVASASGYACGMFLGYLINRTWTFDSRKPIHTREVLAYGGVYGASLVFSVLALAFVVRIIGLSPLIGNVIAIAISTVSNFTGCKFLVFKKSDDPTLFGK